MSDTPPSHRPGETPVTPSPSAVPPAQQPPVQSATESPMPPSVSVPPTGPSTAVAAHAAGPDPVKWTWPSVHREGYKFAGIAAGAALLAFIFGWEAIGWILVLLTAGIAAFFRDPERTTPTEGGILVSPADGLVSQITEVQLPRHLVGEDGLTAGTATRISVFMSVFDVHVNRSPIAGTVRRIAYVPGRFVNADLDKASDENERQYMVVENADGVRVGFTQIAGLVARRIVGFVREGSIVAQGQRIGLIRFGSRVDIFLPAGWKPRVIKGQRAIAGETILAARDTVAIGPGARQ